jgi:hypothetical protein
VYLEPSEASAAGVALDPLPEGDQCEDREECEHDAVRPRRMPSRRRPQGHTQFAHDEPDRNQGGRGVVAPGNRVRRDLVCLEGRGGDEQRRCYVPRLEEGRRKHNGRD